ncbi:MAG: MBL fold metallo-hydrolase [Kiritimatiellaeota bacterium]|nr:MBL fold metallo-hydrolase [Kiritimatiellota bacterium]
MRTFLSARRNNVQCGQECPHSVKALILLPFLLLFGCVSTETAFDGGFRVVRKDDHNLLFHGTTQLLCDFRRDALDLAPAEAYCIGEGERAFIENPQQAYWEPFARKGRFSETEPLSLVPMAGRDVVPVPEGITQLDTPGLTRNSVSYVLDANGKRTVFTGNLIYGDGQILNLYDFQDKWEGANIGGYHGYMARVPKLIASLGKIKALNPDTLIPARGPAIENPQHAIDTLIARLQEVYLNYLSINALWWYFGVDTMTASGRLIFGDRPIPRMPEAQKFAQPPWITEFATTRILHALDGSAFVIDCGGKREFERIVKMVEDGKIKRIEGVFVTHYHHDHVPGVAPLVEKYDCPVYCSPVSRPILERPGAFRMPCVADVPLRNIRCVESLDWAEYNIRFMHFPGQTLYHDAALVTRKGGRPILFVGDSFSPTGIDDYCIWNRNLLEEDQGYFHCLKTVRDMDPRPLLINQHIPPPFEFDDARIEYMLNQLRLRYALLSALFPYPVNFGMDPCWARFEPYCAKPGDMPKLIIRNHAKVPLSFYVDGQLLFRDIPPGEETAIRWPILPYFTKSVSIRCREIPALQTSTETFVAHGE